MGLLFLAEPQIRLRGIFFLLKAPVKAVQTLLSLLWLAMVSPESVSPLYAYKFATFEVVLPAVSQFLLNVSTVDARVVAFAEELFTALRVE